MRDPLDSGEVAFFAFIFGVDVTEDLASATTNGHDGRAPSTQNVSLVNPHEKYTITASDLDALYGDIDFSRWKSSDLAAGERTGDPVLDATLARIDATIGSVTKRAVLKRKIRYRVKVTTPPHIADTEWLLRQGANVRAINALSGEACRYSFQEGKAIFHTNDPITVAALDPSTKEWFWAFRGFGLTFDSVRSALGDRSINITAEDPTRILRLARQSFNPGLFDYEAVKTRYDTSFRTWYVDNLTNLTLPEILHFLIFGSKHAGGSSLPEVIPGVRLPDHLRVGVHGETSVGMEDDGIGAFNYDASEVFILGGTADEEGGTVIGKPFKSISRLAEYQAVVDHRVYPSDLASMMVNHPEPKRSELIARYKKQALRSTHTSSDGTVHEVYDPEIIIRIIGEHPEHYPVDYGRLLVLAPASLGTGINRDLLLKDLIQGPALQTTFDNRLKIILDLVQRIEFSFYATPRGDLVCEMPLYDYDPRDYDGSTSIVIAPFPPEERGNFVARYNFGLEDFFDVSPAFNDDRVRTQMRCPYYLVPGVTDAQTSDQVQFPPAVATLDALIPQFGVRLEQVDPRGFIASYQAALIFAHLQLNIINADAETVSVPLTWPRLGLGPNRTVWIERGNFVGCLRSTQHSLVWASSFDQTLGLNYIRRFSGQVDGDRRPLYEPLGGFAARPFNYKLIFQDQIPYDSTKAFTAAELGHSLLASASPLQKDPAIEALGLVEPAYSGAYQLKEVLPWVRFTSGRRNTQQQAQAMANNVTRNRNWIEDTYTALNPVAVAAQAWVDANPLAVTRAQIADGLLGVFAGFSAAQLATLSRHFEGSAFDVQSVQNKEDLFVGVARSLKGVRQVLIREGGLIIWHVGF